MLAIAFVDVVLAVHIMAVVFAFGIVLAYPLLVPWLRRNHPATMPVLHTLQARIDRTVLTPGMVVVLLAGVYLASKLDVWSEVWVSIPMLILLVLFGLAGGFMAPTERKLSTLAARDLAAGDGALGAEYDAALARWQATQSPPTTSHGTPSACASVHATPSPLSRRRSRIALVTSRDRRVIGSSFRREDGDGAIPGRKAGTGGNVRFSPNCRRLPRP